MGKLTHFKTFENFNSQKLSANEENTKYTLGVDGEVLDGIPDILYQSIVWIKDVQKQWTHGQIYNSSNIDDIRSLIDEALLSKYPIGSVYISLSNVSPSTFIGGTWEQIKDRFLLAAGDTYTAGSTGGEAKHTLTAKELPKQGGTISTHGVYSGTPIAAVSGVFSASHSCSGKYMNGTASGHDSVDTITYSNGGQKLHITICLHI